LNNKKVDKIPDSKADIILTISLAQISRLNSVYSYSLHVLALFLDHLQLVYTLIHQPSELLRHTV
jgi:hypothetical protein